MTAEPVKQNKTKNKKTKPLELRQLLEDEVKGGKQGILQGYPVRVVHSIGDKCNGGSSLFRNTLQLWVFSCLSYQEFPNHVLSYLYVKP